MKRNERNSAIIPSLEHAGNRQKPSERDGISSTKQLTKYEDFSFGFPKSSEKGMNPKKVQTREQ